MEHASEMLHHAMESAPWMFPFITAVTVILLWSVKDHCCCMKSKVTVPVLHHQASLSVQGLVMVQPECPCCLDPIQEKPIAYFTNATTLDRVCPHLYCKDCAEKICSAAVGAANKKCPECRKLVNGWTALDVQQRFHLETSGECFDLFDYDDSGHLDKNEVKFALKFLLPFEPGILNEFVENFWNVWDQDKNGTLDEDEFKSVLVAVKCELQVIAAAESLSKPSQEVMLQAYPLTPEEKVSIAAREVGKKNKGNKKGTSTKIRRPSRLHRMKESLGNLSKRLGNALKVRRRGRDPRVYVER